MYVKENGRASFATGRQAVVFAGLLAMSVGLAPGIAFANETTEVSESATSSIQSTAASVTSATTSSSSQQTAEPSDAGGSGLAESAQDTSGSSATASTSQADSSSTSVSADSSTQESVTDESTVEEAGTAESGAETDTTKDSATQEASSKRTSVTQEASPAQATAVQETAAVLVSTTQTVSEDSTEEAGSDSSSDQSDALAAEIDSIAQQFNGNAVVTYNDGVFSIVLTGDVSVQYIAVNPGESWSIDLAGYTISSSNTAGMPTIYLTDADSSLSIGGGTVLGADATSADGGDALRVTNGSLEVRDGTYLGGSVSESDSEGIGGSALSAYGAKSVVVKSGTLTGGDGSLCGGCGIYLQGQQTQVTIGSLPLYGTYKDPVVTGGNSLKSAGNGLAIEEVSHVTILSGDFEAGKGRDEYTQLYWMRGRGSQSNSWVAGNENSNWETKFNYMKDEIGPDYVTKNGMIIVGDQISSYQDILSGHFSSIRVTKKPFASLFTNHQDVVAFNDDGTEATIQDWMHDPVTLSLAGSIAIVPSAVDAAGNDVSDKLAGGATFTFKLLRNGGTVFTGTYDVVNEDGTVSELQAQDGVITLKANQMALVHALSTAEIKNETQGVPFEVIELSHAEPGEDLRFLGVDRATQDLVVKFAGGEGSSYHAAFLNTYSERHTISYVLDDSAPEGVTDPDGQTAFAGESVELADPASVEGYRFLGWRLPDGTYVTGNMTMGDEDVELVGVWEKIPAPVSEDSQEPEASSVTPVQVSSVTYTPRHMATGTESSTASGTSSLPETSDIPDGAGMIAAFGAALSAFGVRLRRRS